MVDNCYFCKEPLGGTYTFYWDNRCHFRCLPETPDQKIINSQRDLCAALEAKLAERVKVKPLEWTVFCSNSGNSTANTCVGEYVVQHEHDLWMVYLPYEDVRHGKGHETRYEAKAAAQADYESRILSALEATPPAPKVTATHRHKKRGTEYVLIGVGKMQTERWIEPGIYPNPGLADMREVAIYRSVDDGSLWVRPREEFEDGRFEALTAAQEVGKP